MSESCISGQTSEDLLADFESLLNNGSIDLSEDHQIVIISTPNTTSTSAGDILLFATPHNTTTTTTTATTLPESRRTVLGRPPVPPSSFLFLLSWMGLNGSVVLDCNRHLCVTYPDTLCMSYRTLSSIVHWVLL